MKIAHIITVLLCLFTFTCCGKEENPVDLKIDHRIEKITLQEYEINPVKTFSRKEMVAGCDFERNEAYIEKGRGEPEVYKNIVVDFVDLDTGETKRKLKLRRGHFESPTDFYNITWMEFVQDKLVIVDQYEKFVIFDKNLKRLSSTRFMFPVTIFKWYSLDFYQHDNRMHVALLHRTLPYEDHRRVYACLYGFKKDSPLDRIAELWYAKFELKPRKDKKNMYNGQLWALARCFVKKGKLYYSTTAEPYYYIYDLTTKDIKKIELSFLPPRTYTQEESTRLGFFQSDGWQERFKKKWKTQINYVPYPKPLYHLGLYDVGDKKIGVIGAVDLERMRFRLDIIDNVSHQYIKSIWFPFGRGFKIETSDHHKCAVNSYFNIDKNKYVWQDCEGEDFENIVRITTFELKPRE